MHHQIGGLKKKTKRRGMKKGLSVLAEELLRRKLRRRTPSEPWVDVQFETSEGVNDRGEPVVARYHNPRAFPPGGARTLMEACCVCGVLTPPHALEGGQCLDHGDGRGWGRSPSAVAIAGLQSRNLRLKLMKLPSETIAGLKREIARYERRKNGRPKGRK